MPQPTYQMYHVDKMLTNISIAYMQSDSVFIANKVFPIVPVVKQSDRYFKYLKEDWFRDEAEKRAPATESAGGGYEIDNTPTYFCEKYAYHKDVTEEDRVNTDEPLNADRDATEFVASKLLLAREVVWQSTYMKIGIWGKDWAGASSGNGTTTLTYWNASDSTPIEDIHEAQVTMQSTTSFKPNVLVITPWVYNALRDHPGIMDKIKWTQKGIVTLDLIAALFDVEQILVAQAVVNVAAKGAAEDTDFMYGKDALLLYVPARPGLKTPSAGYIFAWSGMLGAGAFGTRIIRIPVPLKGNGTERIEGEMAFDMKVVSSDLGTFFHDIVQ